MKVHELVARFAKASESADPMGSARQVLEGLRGDIGAIESALAYISGVGGNARQVFYRSPGLTMLKVCFPSGRRTPPHDHGTWATILLLSGEEKNTLYRRQNGALLRAGEVTLARGAILPMRAETVHVAEFRTYLNPRRVMRCGQDGMDARRTAQVICRYGQAGQRCRRPSWPQPEGTGRSGRISSSGTLAISTYCCGLSSSNCIPHRLRRTRA